MPCRNFSARQSWFIRSLGFLLATQLVSLFLLLFIGEGCKAAGDLTNFDVFERQCKRAGMMFNEQRVERFRLMAFDHELDYPVG